MKTEKTEAGHTIYRFEKAEAKVAALDYLEKYEKIDINPAIVIGVLPLRPVGFGLLVKKTEVPT